MATALIAVAAAVAILVLLTLVVGLQRRVHRLEAEVTRLRSTALRSEQAVAPPVGAPGPSHGRRNGDPGVDSEAIAVITGLRRASPQQSEEPSLSRVVSVTIAGPMIKVVALAHGVRRALDDESRMRIGYAFRRELRRQRRLQRQGSTHPPRPERPPGVWP